MIFSWYLPEVNKGEAGMFVSEKEVMEKKKKKKKAKQKQKLLNYDRILNKNQEWISYQIAFLLKPAI